MADTGAPWNIPYVENADLVKDYPTASLALANAIDAGLDIAGRGLGSNTVQTVKTDTFTTTSTSYTALTGLSVTITPTSATNKVLVVVTTQGATTNATSDSIGSIRLMRDSTAIGIADAAGNRTQATSIISTRLTGSSALAVSGTAMFIDSPNTTSAVTYSVEARVGGGTLLINRLETDTDTSVVPRSVSTITAIEVAA